MSHPLSRVVGKYIRTAYVIMPVLTFSLIALWISFVAPVAGLPFDTVDEEKGNLLSNASFESWESGLPISWEMQSKQQSINISQTVGHVNGYGLYVQADVDPASPLEIISGTFSAKPKTTYFFKAFYQSDTSLGILLKQNYDNGSSYKVIKQLPDYDYDWSSMSGVFEIDEGVVSAQIVIVMPEEGYVELDATYVVATKEMNTPMNHAIDHTEEPVEVSLNNKWYLYSSGRSEIDSKTFGETYTVSVSKHETGQVGWMCKKLAVNPHELYEFNFDYSSTQFSDVWIDYTRSDGSQFYHNVETLQPTPYLASTSVLVEVPKDVVAMQFSVQLFDDGELVTRNVRARKLHEPAVFSAPKVSITFDDGWASSYKSGASILSQFDFKGTYYINPGLLGDKDYMTNEDITTLLQTGHQIGSHTNTHIDVTSFELTSVQKELNRASTYIKKLGVNTIDFASPYGKYDHKVLPEIMKHHQTHRGTDKGINTRQVLNPGNLKGLFIRQDTTDDELRQYLERARDTNGWLILIYHGVETSDLFYHVDRPTFERHMRIVQESGIQVQTVNQAYKSL